jgi:hypothetical protein
MPLTRPALGGLAVAALLALPATASANGSYSVYACQGPAGTAAPAAGWTANRESDAFATDDCAAGGPLAVGLTGVGPWKGGIGAEQRFVAPANTRIQAVALTRRTLGLPGARGLAYFLNADDRVLDSCQNCSANLTGSLEFPNLNAGMLRFRAGCFEAFPDTCSSSGIPLRVEVPQIAVTLRDTTAPVVKRSATTFNATDTGGGLYRLLVNVDGQPFSATPVAGDTCADAAPADADPYQFLAATPCPLALNGLSSAVDTSAVGNGTHTVDVLIEDAAGNRTVVVPTKSLVVNVAGTLRAWFDQNGRKTYRNRYGRRVVLRGRLVDRNGKGIQGARLDVYHRRGGKLQQLIKTGLKTRKAGKLTLILPLDLTTREIVLAYRARRPGPITSRQTLKLTVVSARGNVIHRRPGKLGRTD